MIDGVPSRPFSAITLPPYRKPEISFADEIIEYSRKTYSTPRAEVEKGILIATGVEEVLTDQSQRRASPLSSACQTVRRGLEDTEMFDAVCTNCEKQIKVPFKPDPSRPVYCKDCFVKSKQKSSTETKKVSLSQLRNAREKFAPPAPRIKEEKPKKQRKIVDTEELKKILEETLPKE